MSPGSDVRNWPRGQFGHSLRSELSADLPSETRRKLDEAAAATPHEEARLVTIQVALARSLPDYWQRFDTLRTRYLAEAPSGGERGGMLARLFGRG